MLRIINNLKLFIENCYREIGVREYSRLVGISAPTASKILKKFESQDLLKKRLDKGYLLFRANRGSYVLKDISRIYWKEKLKKSIEHLNKKFHEPTIILFGSLAKLETKKDSDIDLVVLTNIKKEIDLSKYERLYKREIQLFQFNSLSKVNKELQINILNGYVLQGELK